MQVQQTRSFLDALLAAPAASGAGWLKTLRAEALERAHVLSVPSTRDEDWRFTDLTPLYRTALGNPDGTGASVQAEALASFGVPEAVASLVFVDGRFEPALSRVGAREGLSVGTLSQGVGAADFDPAAWIARAAPVADDLFVAANTARELRDESGEGDGDGGFNNEFDSLNTFLHGSECSQICEGRRLVCFSDRFFCHLSVKIFSNGCHSLVKRGLRNIDQRYLVSKLSKNMGNSISHCTCAR